MQFIPDSAADHQPGSPARGDAVSRQMRPGAACDGLPTSGDAPIHGVARDVICRHVLARLTPAQRAAVAALDLTDGGTMVNMGMNFPLISWRAVWRRPGAAPLGGALPVWRGEIV